MIKTVTKLYCVDACGPAARQRLVEVETLALAGSRLVRIAEQKGILAFRRGVDRGIEHVVAIIEYPLRAVSVMIVDVEDGDARGAAVKHHLRRNGGVVHVAIATGKVRRGVVAWRTAKREGRTATVGDMVGCR